MAVEALNSRFREWKSSFRNLFMEDRCSPALKKERTGDGCA